LLWVHRASLLGLARGKEWIMNLVSIIMQLLTPDLIGRLATMLGVDKSVVQMATGASIPAILAGLGGLAGQGGGAGKIVDAINRLDPNILGTIASTIGGQGEGALATTGTNILGSLLGGTTLSALTAALTKYAGLNQTSAGSLIGTLTPLVLGALGQQQRSLALDAGGLARLLQGQKDNIAQALPGDFSKLLQGSGLLDSLSSNAAATARPFATASTPMSGVLSRGKSPSWLSLLLAAAIVAVAAWYLFGNPKPPPEMTATQPPAPAAPSTTATPPTAPPATAKIMVGDADIGAQLSGVVDTLKTVLPTLKDVASAKAATDKLADAAAKIDKLNGLAGQLPADGKKALAGLALAGLQTVQPMIDQALANSAVAAIAKPALDGIKDKLTALSKS
jgi:hypothetical protein